MRLAPVPPRVSSGRGRLIAANVRARNGPALRALDLAVSLAGLVVDSVIFLYLAFGSLDFLLGQIVGKAWMVLLAIPLVQWLRRRDERLGLAPA